MSYFAERPEEKGEHAYKAKSLRLALPPGFEGLELEISESARHPAYLSGGSSQVLALALLGAACSMNPSLDWYGSLLDLPVPAGKQAPRVQFEYVLEPTLLGERANFTTNVDVLVSDGGFLACGEAKLWEHGLGRCGCEKRRARLERGGERTPDPAEPGGACSPDVLKRDRYWDAARDVLGLRDRENGDACPIAAGYQGVRNIAAARTLSHHRQAAFVLFYDERNPYFLPTGAWPGWPSYLRSLVAGGNEEVEFRACSWQRLLSSGAVSDSVVEWARTKHGLEPDHSSGPGGLGL